MGEDLERLAEWAELERADAVDDRTQGGVGLGEGARSGVVAAVPDGVGQAPPASGCSAASRSRISSSFLRHGHTPSSSTSKAQDRKVLISTSRSST